MNQKAVIQNIMMLMFLLLTIFVAFVSTNKDLHSVTEIHRNYEKNICKDEKSGCEDYRYQGLCRLTIVQQKCKSTCGLCAASPPLHCGLTKYGCCWDNQTQANNSNKAGCPACKDKFELCKFFKEECSTRRDVRLVCPITCEIKCNNCRDVDHQKAMCPSYKNFGFCEISPDLMKQICARTCNFCPL